MRKKPKVLVNREVFDEGPIGIPSPAARCGPQTRRRWPSTGSDSSERASRAWIAAVHYHSDSHWTREFLSRARALKRACAGR